ncbi:MAG: hypothetical protein KAJ19_08580 [Gammaproteobacteria bacterium]|nr:hypothetical protein [Gammaproteobacteria bacterium]
MSVLRILANLIRAIFYPFGLIVGGAVRGIRSGYWYGYTRNGDVTDALIRSGLNDKLREDGMRLKGDV